MSNRQQPSNEKAPAMGVARASEQHQPSTEGNCTMNDMSLSATSQATMSSSEIADLTGKRHADVMRDIRTMLDQLHPDSANLRYQEIQGVAVDHCPQTKRVQAIHLDREHAECLVTGYSASLRMKVIRRLRELEQQATHPQLPQTMAEALRLAADQAERIEQQERALMEAAPKVEFAKRVEVAPDAITVGQAAKTIGTGRTRLFAFLRRHGWVNRKNEPYQAKIESGLLDVKVGQWEHPEQGLQETITTLVTGKGLIKLQKLWSESGSFAA